MRDLALYLRQAIAEGHFETPDGKRYGVECAVDVSGGSVMVTISPAKKDPAKPFWRTYAFTTEQLIRAGITEFLREEHSLKRRHA